MSENQTDTNNDKVFYIVGSVLLVLLITAIAVFKPFEEKKKEYDVFDVANMDHNSEQYKLAKAYYETLKADTGTINGKTQDERFTDLIESTAGNLSFDSLIRMSLKEVNSQCPKQIDEFTSLDKVTTQPDNVICYNYTTTLSSSIIKNLSKERINSVVKPLLVENTKKIPGISFYRQHKTKFLHSYKDAKGKEMFNVMLNFDEY
jgi:hypothetical protein